jgi:predicted MFS family arabinose efflux permease
MLLRFYHQWRNSYMGIPTTIWFLSLVSLINRCGAMVIAFMTVYLTQHLGYGIKEAGYVMGCFGVGALAGAFAGGKLTDRFGYYNIQIISLVLNGIMLLVVMTLQDFWLMCVAVFFLSLVSEIFRPANSVAIAQHCTPETRTRSISLYRMAVNLGWTVAPALGGLLAAIGWHWLFWADGITCILAAVLLRFLVPPVTAVPAVESEPATEGASPTSPYTDRIFLAFSALTVLNAIIFMQILWTVPVFFKEVFHWNEARIGLVAAVNGLIVFLVEMPLIYRMEGRRSPMAYIRTGLVLYGLAYLALSIHFGSGLLPAVTYMIIMSFGEIFVMPFSTNFVFGRAQSHGSQGQYMAIYSMSYSVANILAPLIGTQIIAGWGYSALWYAMGVAALLTIVGFWWLEGRIGGRLGAELAVG